MTALSSPGFAYAQTAPATPEASERQEIVVTASRRDQTVIETPYNVSAFSATVLEQSNITDVASLSRFTPGIAVLDIGAANRVNRNPITIRGLNVNSADIPIRSDGAVPTVSQYIGETPVQFPVRFFDVERVELLRGPQGTLYGSGALAGTLRVIPALPKLGEYSGSLAATFGAPEHSDEYDRGFEGALNLPLGERAALRLAGGVQALAGFIDSAGLVQLDASGVPVRRIPSDADSGFVVLPRSEDTNDSESNYLRGTLRFEPTSDLDITLSHEYQRAQADNPQEVNSGFPGAYIDSSFTNYPGSLYANALGSPAGQFPNGGATFPRASTYDQYRLIASPSERESNITSLVIEVDLEFATLTSSTSYTTFGSEAFSDRLGAFSVTRRPGGRNLASFYGFYPRLIPFTRNRVDDEFTTQEVRLVSADGGNFDYVIGAFYQKQETKQDLLETVPGVADYFGLPVGTTNTTFTDLREFEFTDTAIFGELTYHVTDAWQITAGVRQFWQEFTLEGTQTFPFCGAACANDGLEPTGLVRVPNANSEVDDQIFKLNTSYDFGAFNAYATYSEGFRRGGANNAPVSGFYASLPQNLTYEPDTVRNYEAGVKGRWEGAFLSASVFLEDWEKFQFQAVTPSGGSGIVLDGSEAQTQGIELEASNFNDIGFSYSLGYTYVKAEVTEGFVANDLFFGAPTQLIQINEGDRLPGVPENTLTAILGYGWALSDTLSLKAQVDASYRSDAVTYFPRDLTTFATIDGFSVLNGRVTLEKAGSWSATAFVDNIADEIGATAGNFTSFEVGLLGSHRFVMRPRTIGVRLTYDFGS